MNEKKNIPFYAGSSTLLSIFLIIVKLIGYRNYPWWLVLLPIYCPLFMMIITILFSIIFAKLTKNI